MCAFCGGRIAATTEDHWPPRSFFRDRAWPEGFVFPACDSCNRVSSPAEQVVGLLLHGSHDGHDRAKYQRVIAGVRRDFPEVFERLFPKSARERRNMLRWSGLQKPEGMSLSEIPMVRLPMPVWEPYFDIVARKMMLALHYQAFGIPLSKAGLIWHTVHTNAEKKSEQFLLEILKIANIDISPRRGNKSMANQFELSYQVDPEQKTAVWVFAFHRRLAFTGVTTEDPNSPLNSEQRVYRNFELD
jgi:hypothetical protein